MNKYLVFAYDQYYPEGGAFDFKSGHETIESAMAVDISEYDGANIFDVNRCIIIAGYWLGKWAMMENDNA